MISIENSSKISTKARPQSKKSIRKIVRDFKEQFKISNNGRINIVKVLEKLQNEEFLELEIVTDNELKNSYAETDIIRRKIIIQEKVYIGASRGNHRDIFTLAHELGHAVLHTGEILLCRVGEVIKSYENPEWQANYFAAEFLAPLELVKLCSSFEEVSETFQISKKAAKIKFNE